MEHNITTGKKGNGWLFGGILIALGVVFMLGQFIPRLGESIVATVILGGIGGSFFAVYLNDRNHWWALIPAYTMGSIAAVVFLGGFVGEAAMALLPFAIALPFFYVYLKDNKHWWALIPAYFWGAIGLAAVLATIFGEGILGVVIPGAIALPFLALYAHDRHHWWALIPGGVMLSIAVGVAVSSLWSFVPVVMIAAGIYLLIRQSGGKVPAFSKADDGKVNEFAREPEFTPIMDHRQLAQTPVSGPEADK